MGKARKITLDTRAFEKAGDATVFFRDMLHRYQIGQHISDADSEDLMALLKRHDEREEKEGVGMSHFEVGDPPEHSGRCFWIIRTDGSRVAFSFVHCLENKPGD